MAVCVPLLHFYFCYLTDKNKCIPIPKEGNGQLVGEVGDNFILERETGVLHPQRIQNYPSTFYAIKNCNVMLWNELKIFGSECPIHIINN